MKLVSLFLLLFSSHNLLAQNNSLNAIVSIKYEFNYVTDTMFRDKIYKEKMILYVNNSQSKFFSYSKKVEDSLGLLDMEAMVKTGTIVSKPRNNRIQSTVYKYFNNDTFNNIQEYLTTFFLIKTVQRPINWQIVESKKNILGYECQKAVCSFKGRKYEVWFANQLPISAGPWKLNGLPGIILEARDSKSEVNFISSEIELITQANTFLSLPTKYKLTTQKEYDEIKEYYTNNPAEVLKTVLGENDFSAKIASTQNASAPKRKIKKPSNPIELTEE